MTAEQLWEKLNSLPYEAQSAPVVMLRNVRENVEVKTVTYDQEHHSVILGGSSDEENE